MSNKKEYKFKVGDLVEITKGRTNWAVDMDVYIGRQVILTEVNSRGSGNCSIQFEGCGDWSWIYDDGHFKLVGSEEKIYEIW